MRGEEEVLREERNSNEIRESIRKQKLGRKGTSQRRTQKKAMGEGNK